MSRINGLPTDLITNFNGVSSESIDKISGIESRVGPLYIDFIDIGVDNGARTFRYSRNFIEGIGTKTFKVKYDDVNYQLWYKTTSLEENPSNGLTTRTTPSSFSMSIILSDGTITINNNEFLYFGSVILNNDNSLVEVFDIITYGGREIDLLIGTFSILQF